METWIEEKKTRIESRYAKMYHSDNSRKHGHLRNWSVIQKGKTIRVFVIDYIDFQSLITDSFYLEFGFHFKNADAVLLNSGNLDI